MGARSFLFLLLLVPALAAAAVRSGMRAPDFRLRDLAGRPMRLSALRGRVVLLDFWASWCEPCRRSVSFYGRLARRYGPRGLCVIGVSVDEHASNVRSFLRETPAGFRILHDEEGQAVASRYQPDRMPASFLIDRDGIVRHVFLGFDSSDEMVIERQVRELLGR